VPRARARGNSRKAGVKPGNDEPITVPSHKEAL
jgi:hypothetical protein